MSRIASLGIARGVHARTVLTATRSAEERERPPFWRAAIETWPGAAAFVASRFAVALTLYVAPVLLPSYRRSSFFSDWDGAHYLLIAQLGYPPVYTPGGGFDATVAFFPGFPLLARALHFVLGLSTLWVGIAIANFAALAACCLVWRLFRDLTNSRTATAGVVLVALWPASFVLSMFYPESLLLAFAAGCFLALHHRRWLWAGALALLAGAVSPDGLLLVLSVVWAAAVNARGTPWWPRVTAVVLSPLGGIAYFSYLWSRFGTPLIWSTAEHRGWGRGFDFGHRFFADVGIALGHPTARIDLVASSASGVLGAALVIWMVKSRAPGFLTVYAGAVMCSALFFGFGGSVPRFCLDAFPIFYLPASRLRGLAMHTAVALLAAALVLFMLIVELTRTTVP